MYYTTNITAYQMLIRKLLRAIINQLLISKMKEGTLSKEIISVFEYIKENICKEYPNALVNEYVFILSILKNKDSLAYHSLSSIVVDSTLDDMKELFTTQITFNVNGEKNMSPYSIFDKYFEDCEIICKQMGIKEITSSILLLSIIKKHEEISKIFRDFAITVVQLVNSVKSHTIETPSKTIETPKKHQKKKKKNNLSSSKSNKITNSTIFNGDGEIEYSLMNISHLSAIGKVSNVIGYEKYYDEIFAILSKKDRNNVAICGNYGVGKTATAYNLANLINNKQCNSNFHNKILVELDFSKLVVGTPFKGAFEQKFYSIVNEAKENGNYIFFIDNLHLLLNGNTKYAETDIESLLTILLIEPSIQVICTMTPKMFSSIQTKSQIGKYFNNVTIEEPTIDECVNILTESKYSYETYHDVKYTDDAIKTCVELCKKYMTNRSLPDSALDLLDMVGAKINMNFDEPPSLKNLKEKLSDVIDEINFIKGSSTYKEYETIDELTKKQISLKSQISIIEKEEILSKKATEITKNDVCSILAKEIDLPLEELTQDEKIRLKGLSEKIKESVIGQDEAVDEVCRAVKRQRIGLGENDRPAVLIFLGSTGTGKTLLAKELAKEVFGDEKYFVRMDMSEYSDKTSVNKITGSSAGYVGYEDETLLVKALKNKKRFVLLLDEIEKASDEVYNMFLQIFDEGRFTDNHSETYSLKDVIIIMTSNVGVAEAANRGKAIGFSNDGYDFSQSIIEKELKRKFKPEFLNRIQKIVYFNKLNNDNLKSIISLEIEKINKKVEKLGYHLDQDILKTKMVDNIYENIITKKEFGARPIVNEVQRKIEDSIVDYLIENEVEEGHTFTYNELISL